MTYTRDDWKAAKAALDLIEAERERLLVPTKERFETAQEELATIEEQIGGNLGYCEGCSEPIFEGEPYHGGIDVSLCAVCAPSYADMLAHPESFGGENDEPMTPAEAAALFEAHIANGGSPDDKMAHA
jgi:hypothetical protein